MSDGPADVPESVIVKHADLTRSCSEADRLTPPEWLVLNDWAGLRFTGRMFERDPIAPRFYAGNREACLFVAQDLGRLERLDDYLMGDDRDAAEGALIGYSKAMGRLHAHSRGREDEYRALREPLGPTPETIREYLTYGWLTEQLGDVLEPLGWTAGAQASRDLRRLIEALRDPGPFRVYMQGDACPDNCLFLDSAPLLIDFEGGGYGHALLDGTYGLLPFPTCWCVARLPADVSRRMASVYRSELVKGCAVAGDDRRYFRAVVECCLFWALFFFSHFSLSKLLDEDRQIVVASARQRCVRKLELAGELSERHGHLEALGNLLGRAAGRLRELWPSGDCELPEYPAFSSGQDLSAQAAANSVNGRISGA